MKEKEGKALPQRRTPLRSFALLSALCGLLFHRREKEKMRLRREREAFGYWLESIKVQLVFSPQRKGEKEIAQRI